MKYLINESQLDRMIGNFLDSKELQIIKNNYGVFFVYGPDDMMGQIRVIPISHKLLINRELSNEVEGLFGLDEYDSQLPISDWVSEKLNIEIEPWDIKTVGGYTADNVMNTNNY